MNQTYIDTVRLLLAIAPAVFASGRFAMKGGTALNLFVQDMPRLSVDIDVVYTDHVPDRDTALQHIAQELGTIKSMLEGRGLQVRQPTNALGDEVRLLVANDTALVKVEVNFVFRGTVLPVQAKPLVDAAQDIFTTAVSVPVLAIEELYGSKLVAAMDRQHPRDLFDVMHMLSRFGWQASFVDCFVAYLAGHNRPVHEVLFPKIKPLEPAFTNEFVGMTRDEVTLETLMQTQAQLIDELPRHLLSRHREFLLSLVRCEPDWTSMPFAHLRELPAVKWKLMNLGKLKKSHAKRFAAQHDELVTRFDSLRF
ncbi:MAG TPA: nucleotidyl transferase AbiEii/AbiGii toxin family protein [Rhodoferax sp.]|nr:nucleotidyl transferase AbiEii/AbiGii toxin family protein [Rhodoferax sp.]